MSSITLFCDEFHCSAGCVLFRFDTPSPQICILRNRRNNEYVLPKGHKDLDETLKEAAIRETYEETGYPCELLPVNLLTRVPPPGVSSGDSPREAADATEAIAITVRNLEPGNPEKNVKLVWWYIAQITSSRKVNGTQMDTEDLESQFLDADVAIRTLSRSGDRDVAGRALALVKASRGLNPTGG